MKPIKALILIALFGVVQSLGAQGIRLGDKGGVDFPRPPQSLLSGLMDPSRLTIHQSVSFAYGSVGKKAFGQGLYLNTLSYRLADPLSIQVQWGLLSASPRSPFSGRDAVNGFLKQASIRYRPSENFLIRLDFSSSPVWGYGLDGYGW